MERLSQYNRSGCRFADAHKFVLVEVWRGLKRFDKQLKEQGQMLKAVLARMDEKNVTFNAPIGHLLMCAGVWVLLIRFYYA